MRRIERATLRPCKELADSLLEKLDISETEIESLAEKCAEGRQFGIPGEPGVNFLLLNMTLGGIG